MNEVRNTTATLIIRGAGEMATGVAHKLWHVGFRIVLTEIKNPLAIRRGVAFADAVFQGVHTVEGVEARCVDSLEAARRELDHHRIPVLIDAELTQCAPLLEEKPCIVIDARMLKTSIDECYPKHVTVIGLGPGFTAPGNARFVIETNRGHNLGRVIEEGKAEDNTGVPAEVLGATYDRVLYAPACGEFHALKNIGDWVNAGDIMGGVGDCSVTASITGVLRGLLHDRTPVTPEIKVADIDPRGDRRNCFLISDKARAIAGGVLEAVLMSLRPSG